MNHVLLRPPPFPQSQNLLVVRLPHPTEHDVSLSVADFLDWRSQDRTFQSVSAYTNDILALSGAGEPIVIPGAGVTDEFFSLGRSAAREREIVLRISLGANARKLLQQFLTESLVIANDFRADALQRH